MAKDKLKKVNVPELFHKHFLANRPVATGSVLELLKNITPSARGRGFTRVLPEVTQAQYDELYQYAAEARAAMPGAERDTVLRAAICGKSLAERMEAAGVTSPVTYTPTRTRKASAPATPTAPATPAATATAAALTTVSQEATDEATDEEEDTNLDSIISEPVTLDTADDLEGVSDDELDGFGQDLSLGG